MDYLDFSMNFSSNSPSSSNDFNEIFKTECIADDNVLNIINPDDFLNESFFSEFKFKTESENQRRKSSESSSSVSINSENGSPQQPMQLTPPISPHPHPIVIDNTLYQSIRVIPIATQLLPQQQQQQQQFHQVERKIKPLIPKPSLSSSDSDTAQNYVVNAKTNSPVDKALIKQARLMRNRESALLSRNKKKEYLQNLEVEVNNLRKENHLLKEENSILKAKLKSYTNFTCRCASSISSKLPPKNASLLFALLLMVGFNIIPLSNLFTATNSIKKSIAKPNVEFHARHLLFINNTDDTNSTVEFDQDNPLYFNQTDLIRKANIENIRRWIPQPDLFNVTNLNDFNFADMEEKEAKMHEKLRDQMTKKHAKAKKKLPKKKIAQERKIPVQLYDTNFFKLHEFFEEINRKEDTFYLFSFKADHLLLPADYPQNFSQIIKMNLIMPRNNESMSSSSDKITMMQIETIILNTSLIQITEKSIPEDLKLSYSNSTQIPMCNEERRNFEDSTKEQRPFKRANKFAPYFSAFDHSINSPK